MTGVSPRRLQRWKKAASGVSLGPSCSPGEPRKIGLADEAALCGQVAAHPDATLDEHRAQWATGHEPVSRATMSRTLQRVGSVAQKQTLIATESEDVGQDQWRAEMARVDPATLVFLDVTGTQITMTRLQGRVPRGQRVVGTVARNHGAKLACLVAMGPASMHAPCVFDGAVDSTLFATRVRDWLVPTLPRGTVVVLDNLSVHWHDDVRPTIEAAGCQVRYLPAYSPDYNLIELAFAKLKTYLRGVAEHTHAALLHAIGVGLDRILGRDIAGDDRHCGFALPIPEAQPS